jgi:hypothetical protein
MGEILVVSAEVASNCMEAIFERTGMYPPRPEDEISNNSLATILRSGVMESGRN